MSLWKTLFALVGGAVAGPAAGKIIDAAITMLNNPQTGGLAGLVQTFRNKGLDDVVSSWIGTGENRAASAEQMHQALGEDRIQQVAQSAGVTNQEASQGLAALLPQIIDMLTPDGRLPEGAGAQGGGTQGAGPRDDALAQALAGIRNKLMA
ncbi:MAG: YidB family protein [Gammaproteobacteria bacterium]